MLLMDWMKKSFIGHKNLRDRSVSKPGYIQLSTWLDFSRGKREYVFVVLVNQPFIRKTNWVKPQEGGRGFQVSQLFLWKEKCQNFPQALSTADTLSQEQPQTHTHPSMPVRSAGERYHRYHWKVNGSCLWRQTGEWDRSWKANMSASACECA